MHGTVTCRPGQNMAIVTRFGGISKLVLLADDSTFGVWAPHRAGGVI
jgi:hypothetical protein